MKKITLILLLMCTISMIYSEPQQEIQEKETPIYIIVNSDVYYYLQDEVNLKIKEGYIPLGGVSCGAGYSKREFVQAMVLKEYFDMYLDKKIDI